MHISKSKLTHSKYTREIRKIREITVLPCEVYKIVKMTFLYSYYFILLKIILYKAKYVLAPLVSCIRSVQKLIPLHAFFIRNLAQSLVLKVPYFHISGCHIVVLKVL